MSGICNSTSGIGEIMSGISDFTSGIEKNMSGCKILQTLLKFLNGYNGNALKTPQ